MSIVEIQTRENNYMSLSCRARMRIVDGLVEEIDFNGMERSGGLDSWTGFYKGKKRGDKVSEKEIKEVLSYHGRNNIVSVLEEK